MISVPQLALPGIGGIFETGALDEPLAGARLTNEALLNAVRALAWFKSREVVRSDASTSET